MALTGTGASSVREGETRDEEEARLAMRELAALGVVGETEQFIPTIARFLGRLRRVGAHTNLVSAADLERLGQRHLLESFNILTCGLDLDWSSSRLGPLLDAGSGGGFPGLPLAIVLPQLRVALVESVRKKARFLAETVEELGLADRVRVVAERVEDLALSPEWRGQFPLLTARGFGPLPRTLPWCAPLLAEGGSLIAFKSTQVDRELTLAANAMRKERLELVSLVPMRWGEGRMVVLRKRGREKTANPRIASESH